MHSFTVEAAVTRRWENPHVTSRMPFFAVLLAAILFGTTGTSQALAGLDASATSVGAARIVAGGALLAVIALASRARQRKGAQAKASALPRWRTIAVIAVGAAGVVAYQPAFFQGTTANGVAIGTVVALGSAPLLTGVADALLTRRLPSGRWMIATATAVVGVVLVADVTGETSVDIGGLFASVGAGASYMVYTLASKELIQHGWHASSAMGAVFGVAALASVPLLAVAGVGDLVSAKGAALIAWLAVATTAAAYVLFGWGLARLPAATVSTLTLAEPLTATTLGLAVLHESLSPASGLGLVVIATGLALLAAPSRVSESAGSPPSPRSADAASQSGES